MAKNEAPLLQLQDYIPDGSLEGVMQYLNQYKVHLTITRERAQYYRRLSPPAL